MSKKLNLERTLDDIVWQMYPKKHYDNILKCAEPLPLHLRGECPVCGAVAKRPSRHLFLNARLHTIEDSAYLLKALKYLMPAIVMTCREMQLPMFASEAQRGTGQFLKAQFFVPVTNTFVFVENSTAKLTLFRRAQEEFERRYWEQIAVQDRKAEPPVRYKLIYLISTNDPNEPVKKFVPSKNELLRQKEAEKANDPRLKVERLVNPKNASDICYVPFDVFDPIVEHYNGDKDRATRRWWRREFKRRKKFYD